MMYVTEVYEYLVIADQSGSADAIGREAWMIAKDFFGDHPFDLTVNISGRKGQWIVQAQASASFRADETGAQGVDSGH